ncbi:Protein FAR1-RELATED SEQUENCE 5 [Glycine max]|nr:Protein FAR1-RELATED SEQUENCE 5 [Glycine max]
MGFGIRREYGNKSKKDDIFYFKKILKLKLEQVVKHPKKFLEYVSKKTGGISTAGYTRQDHKNYLQTRRKQSLKQQSENPSFFHDFQIDVEEQITNIFWADAQMINDYGYFAMSSHLTRHTRQQTRIIDH